MKTTSLTLSDELYDRLKIEARKRKCSMARILRESIERQLEVGPDWGISLQQIPRHRCGRVKARWSRDQIYDEVTRGHLGR